MQSPFISAHQSADHIVSRIILNLETVKVLQNLIALKSIPYYLKPCSTIVCGPVGQCCYIGLEDLGNSGVGIRRSYGERAEEDYFPFFVSVGEIQMSRMSFNQAESPA